MTVNEHDVVRLKDGRKGTVVLVYDSPSLAYEVEIVQDDGDSELVTVKPQDIQEVTWSMKK